MARGYGQFCGLARALELIGGRWSLLIVRELLVGPKRFTELTHGLPGIPTNVLSSRLRELEEAGVLQRALQAGRSTSVVYELTPYGLALEGPMVQLGFWGAESLARPTNDASFSRSALAVALRGVFDPSKSKGRDLAVELRFDPEPLRIVVTGGQVTFPSEPLSGPHVVLEMAPYVLAEMLGGYVDLDAAFASGQLRVHGSKREARRFFEIFRLPLGAAQAG